MVDVAVIGCGVTGAAVACALARRDVSVLVLEAENDVAMRTTKANSGILHAGYDPEPGTRMAKWNVRGAQLIVAVNRDEKAPIMSACDYGIVGDMFEIVPLLTKAINESK